MMNPSELLRRINPRDYILFASEGRSVTRIYGSGETDILLTCWEPGQASSFHDHGASESFVIVLEGFIAVNSGGVERIRVGPGEVIVTPQGAKHQLSNEEDVRAVTLHVYAPPLRPTRPISQPFRDLTQPAS